MSKVLVVDDDPGVLFMLEEVLREVGHEVVTASDPNAALDLLDGVDAAVVDIHMPGASRSPWLARMRERNAAIPVLILTADASIRSTADARTDGAFHVMTKPVDIDELAAVLERALHESGESRAPRGEGSAP